MRRSSSCGGERLLSVSPSPADHLSFPPLTSVGASPLSAGCCEGRRRSQGGPSQKEEEEEGIGVDPRLFGFGGSLKCSSVQLILTHHLHIYKLFRNCSLCPSEVSHQFPLCRQGRENTCDGCAALPVCLGDAPIHFCSLSPSSILYEFSQERERASISPPLPFHCDMIPSAFFSTEEGGAKLPYKLFLPATATALLYLVHSAPAPRLFGPHMSHLWAIILKIRLSWGSFIYPRKTLF